MKNQNTVSGKGASELLHSMAAYGLPVDNYFEINA